MPSRERPIAMRAAALTSLLSLALAGCATLWERPLATQLIVQQATLRFIGEDAERAERVVEAVERLQVFVSSEPASIDDLQAQALQAIRQAELSLADQQLAQGLVLLVADELRARVGDGTIEPPGLVEAQAVLRWVAQAAQAAQTAADP